MGWGREKGEGVGAGKGWGYEDSLLHSDRGVAEVCPP
jgi:hypothetical protein